MAKRKNDKTLPLHTSSHALNSEVQPTRHLPMLDDVWGTSSILLIWSDIDPTSLNVDSWRRLVLKSASWRETEKHSEREGERDRDSAKMFFIITNVINIAIITITLTYQITVDNSNMYITTFSGNHWYIKVNKLAINY